MAWIEFFNKSDADVSGPSRYVNIPGLGKNGKLILDLARFRNRTETLELKVRVFCEKEMRFHYQNHKSVVYSEIKVDPVLICNCIDCHLYSPSIGMYILVGRLTFSLSFQ